MVWNCIASLNFKGTNFSAIGLKNSYKRKTLVYCNEKKLILIKMAKFCLGFFALFCVHHWSRQRVNLVRRM